MVFIVFYDKNNNKNIYEFSYLIRHPIQFVFALISYPFVSLTSLVTFLKCFQNQIKPLFNHTKKHCFL